MRGVSVGASIAQMTTAQLISAALSLLVVIVTARTLGPEGRGLFVAAITWSAAFAAVFGLSLGPALAHHIQSNARAVPQGVLFGTLAGAGVGLALLGGACLVGAASLRLLGNDFAADPQLALVAGLLVPLLLWEPYALALHGHAGSLDRYARALLAGRAAIAILVCVVVVGIGKHPAGVMLAVVVGQLTFSVMTGATLLRDADYVAFSVRELLQMLPAALKLHLTNVAVMAIDAVSVLLVFGILSAEEAGLYQLAQQAVAIVLLLPTATGIVLQGRMMRYRADEDWPTQRRIIMRVFALVAACVVLLSWAAPVAIQVLGGDAYLKSAETLRVLAFAAFGPALAALLAPQWIGRGVFRLNAALTIIVAVTLLVTTAWATRTSGVWGAAITRAAILGGAVTILQACFFLWIERRYRIASTIKS